MFLAQDSGKTENCFVKFSGKVWKINEFYLGKNEQKTVRFFLIFSLLMIVITGASNTRFPKINCFAKFFMAGKGNYRQSIKILK